jgi:hypothetical protein
MIYAHKDFETSVQWANTKTFGMLFAHARHRVLAFSLASDQSPRSSSLIASFTMLLARAIWRFLIFRPTYFSAKTSGVT